MCKASNGDVRLVLGQLQMFRLRMRALSFDHVKVGFEQEHNALLVQIVTLCGELGYTRW